MRRRLLLSLLMAAGLVGGVVASQVHATTVLPLNMEQMLADASRVFIGTCSSVEAGKTAEGIPYTAYTFAVSEGLKGDIGGTVMIRQFGLLEPRRVDNKMIQAFRVLGMPTYKPGQKMLLLLGSDSELGLTSPVGLFQGAFTISLDTEGAEVAVNGSDNVNLFRDIDNLPAVAAAHRRGPVKLSLLRGMILQPGQ